MPDVSLSRRSIRRIFYSILILLAQIAHAAGSSDESPIHWSADKTYWDRKNNIVQLIGNGSIHQPGESISADSIQLDLNTRDMDAKGNCVYIASDTSIHSDEMHFNLDTHAGTVVGGRVSNESFTLIGERINKLGPTRFQAHRAEYSTCADCPQTWSLRAQDVSLEVGGYAYMSGVIGKIKDAPFFWLPYLIIPIKTERQTGFLFPRIGIKSDSKETGVTFVQPFFWAINRSSDMTFAYGTTGTRGRRIEWEGRYALAPRSSGTFNFYSQKDSQFLDRSNRWAVNATQTHELPFGIDQKLRLSEISDNLYPYHIGDIGGAGDGHISSDLIFSHSTHQVSSYVAGRRVRNLLNPDKLGFDADTVQVFPKAELTTNNRFIFGSPLAAGITFGVSNFIRPNGAYDLMPVDISDDPQPTGEVLLGRDPIRKATRVSVTPSLYTTFRPWDVFSLVPSLQYRGFFYSFHNEIPNLSRGYLVFKTDFSTQWERIFYRDSRTVPRVKHLIRPLLTYNLIPVVHEPKANPFYKQIEYARTNGFSGFNFDNNDIVPLDSSRTYTNYFVPIGHSIAYGVTSQLIRKKHNITSLSDSYETSVELKTGQSFNFRELRNASGDRQPFSRLFADLGLTFNDFSSSTSYVYVPYIPAESRHILSTSAVYTWDKRTVRRIFTFERSANLSYSYMTIGSRTSNLRGGINYSVSEYFAPSAMWNYDMFAHRMMDITGGLRFQSPAQCWKVDLGMSHSLNCGQEGGCNTVTVDFSLNLTGTGFGGVTEAANTAVSH